MENKAKQVYQATMDDKFSYFVCEVFVLMPWCRGSGLSGLFARAWCDYMRAKKECKGVYMFAYGHKLFAQMQQQGFTVKAVSVYGDNECNKKQKMIISMEEVDEAK